MASSNYFELVKASFEAHYKDQVDEDLLFSYIQHCADSTEFFIQKGMGWALRKYSKTKPEVVRGFIESHELSALTVREGLKWLQRKKIM